MTTSFNRNRPDNLLVHNRENRLHNLDTFAPLSGPYVMHNGRSLISFASNDWLGLSSHPCLKENAIRFVTRYGVNNASSHLSEGNIDGYDRVEKKLADLTGFETALLFQSEAKLLEVLFSELFSSRSVIAVDRLMPRSTAQTLAKYSAETRAKWFSYRHWQHEDARVRLCSEIYDDCQEKWLLNQSLYALDGSVESVPALEKMHRNFGIKVLLDDSNAAGVLGVNGMGLASYIAGNGLAFGSFARGLGCAGAYLLCSHEVKSQLLDNCKASIYAVPMQPSALGAIDAALDIVPGMHKERLQLLQMAEDFRKVVLKMGFETGPSSTQIISILAGTDSQAIRIAEHLYDNGIFAAPIRPSNLAQGNARLRISISLKHEKEHIFRLLRCLSNFRKPPISEKISEKTSGTCS